MSIKSLQIGFIGLILSVATAWAGSSGIEGIVKDVKGRPIKGVKTDGSGRYVSDGLAGGVYRVTLIVNGAVKAAIMNTRTKADQLTQLNFDLKPVSPSQASGSAKKGKHWVWVPPKTGTHTGGGWVEVDDTGSSAAGAENVQQINGQQLQQQIHDTRSTKGP